MMMMMKRSINTAWTAALNNNTFKDISFLFYFSPHLPPSCFSHLASLKPV